MHIHYNTNQTTLPLEISSFLPQDHLVFTIEKAQSLIERHKEINNMERVLRKTHIKRLNKGECSTQAGVNFIDIISHYTRVSDHAMNLAEKVIAEQI